MRRQLGLMESDLLAEELAVVQEWKWALAQERSLVEELEQELEDIPLLLEQGLEQAQELVEAPLLADS